MAVMFHKEGLEIFPITRCDRIKELVKVSRWLGALIAETCSDLRWTACRARHRMEPRLADIVKYGKGIVGHSRCWCIFFLFPTDALLIFCSAEIQQSRRIFAQDGFFHFKDYAFNAACFDLCAGPPVAALKSWKHLRKLDKIRNVQEKISKNL